MLAFSPQGLSKLAWLKDKKSGIVSIRQIFVTKSFSEFRAFIAYRWLRVTSGSRKSVSNNVARWRPALS
jgi:hypothetical protein